MVIVLSSKKITFTTITINEWFDSLVVNQVLKFVVANKFQDIERVV
jgi:hypothetical protein